MTGHSTTPGITVQVEVKDSAEASIHIVGDLGFTTVPVAYEKTRDCFAEHRKVIVDLEKVGRSDSAALALVLEWQRLAKEAGAELILQNIPPMLHNIARVSELDEQLL